MRTRADKGNVLSRAQRLLDLIQILRSHRFPVTAAHLAAQLDISVRTLYRDIKTLKEQGANIEGEPGMGYVLRSGFMLPPLMFSVDEVEALVLGSRWVAARGDELLGNAARNALTKITAVLPDDLQYILNSSALLVGPGAALLAEDTILFEIRQAILNEYKVEMGYRDLKEVDSVRMVWPFALGFFDNTHLLVAWCELRQEFRNFRIDRILKWQPTSQRYPKRRQALLKAWREKEGISAQ